MSLWLGEEFKINVSPELWRRPAYLPESGTGSVLTPDTQHGGIAAIDGWQAVEQHFG